MITAQAVWHLDSRITRLHNRLAAVKVQSDRIQYLQDEVDALAAQIIDIQTLDIQRLEKELSALESNLPNIFRELSLPLSTQIDNLRSIASTTEYLSALARIDTVLYSTQTASLEWNLNIKRYHATIHIEGTDPSFPIRSSTVLPGDAVFIRCILPGQGSDPPSQAYVAGVLISPPPSLSSSVQGSMIFRLANRTDAPAVGRIRISGLSYADGLNPTKHPINHDFIPPAPVMGPDGPMDPQHQPIARYSIVTYNPRQLIGGNIYIQPTEPLDPNCVWIDTNGIDLITN